MPATNSEVVPAPGVQVHVPLSRKGLGKHGRKLTGDSRWMIQDSVYGSQNFSEGLKFSE